MYAVWICSCGNCLTDLREGCISTGNAKRPREVLSLHIDGPNAAGFLASRRNVPCGPRAQLSHSPPPKPAPSRMGPRRFLSEVPPDSLLPESDHRLPPPPHTVSRPRAVITTSSARALPQRQGYTDSRDHAEHRGRSTRYRLQRRLSMGGSVDCQHATSEQCGPAAPRLCASTSGADSILSPFGYH